MRNSLISLIHDQATTDSSVVLLTGDLGYSVLEPLQQQLGERFINGGVAEANLIGLSAGLANNGYTPFVYSIAPFISMRCFEQVRNDVCYNCLPVRLIGIGAGYSYGNLGPSHFALEDANILSALPNIKILCPGTKAELASVYNHYGKLKCPIYYRIGKGPGADVECRPFEEGDPVIEVYEGGDATIVVSGEILEEVVAAREILYKDLGYEVGVLSVPLIHPFPVESVIRRLSDGPTLGVFEGYEGNPLEYGLLKGLANKERLHTNTVKFLCAPKKYPLAVGDQKMLRRAAGLDAQNIASTLGRMI